MTNPNLYLLSQILQSQWLLDPSFSQGALPLVKHLMDGHSFAPDMLGKKMEAKTKSGWQVETAEGNAPFASFAEAPQGSIAQLKLSGPLMRGDGLCAKGMESMGRIIQEADASENVQAILLEFETPGGTVNGTQELAEIIKATEKPVYAFGHYAASAGYWLASACDEIWASSKTATFGSIGVMASFVDMQGMYEEQGVRFHELYAEQSPDKNRAFRMAKEGDYEPYIKEVLNPLAEIFQQEMESLRGLGKEAMTGKTYLAGDAQRLGLIDRIGSKKELIAHIKNGGSKGSAETISNHHPPNKNTMAEQGKGNFWGWLSGASQSELERQQEALEGLQSRYEKATARLAELETSLSEKEEAIAELKQQLETAVSEKEKFEKLANSYGSKAGEFPSRPEKAGQDIVQEDSLPDYYDPEAEHNRMAQFD